MKRSVFCGGLADGAGRKVFRNRHEAHRMKKSGPLTEDDR